MNLNFHVSNAFLCLHALGIWVEVEVHSYYALTHVCVSSCMCRAQTTPVSKLLFAVCRWFNGIWCVHKVLQQFSTLHRSKMENFAKHLTTYNDETCYAKHVLDPLCVFFTLLGCGGGGAPKGSRAQPPYAVFQPRQLKNRCPSPLFGVPCRRQ